ncbi:hypothetical protein SAMN05216338_101868 [Bradyrhizobium sp. Rc2d]|uniref:hypothetical protein n=1 Tax=Bradyrhizobium sp. Rc2d TaxID=1855321 RepID=UPI00088BA119|nr:hypothetical protein [Bradyrhizobium sp. Rc2d]SDI17809.1 hypothetical protein SAMN05216338_101868 [Bradyrhizobium sp. Rc2d]
MNRKWILAGSGALLLGLVGVAIVTAEPEGRGAIFIAGDKPVSEDQIRQKLQSDGWSNVQIVRNDGTSRRLARKTAKPRMLPSIRRTADYVPAMTTTRIE